MSAEACSVCGVDPTTREGWLAVASRTQVIDGKRYCYACAPVDGVERHRRLADHGISPAQLREKVEALEKRIQNVDEGVSDYIDDFKNTLDAALKRIENLERDMGDVHPNALSGAKT